MYASRYVVVMLLSQWFFAIFNGIICVVNGVGLIRYTTIVNIMMLGYYMFSKKWREIIKSGL